MQLPFKCKIEVDGDEFDLDDIWDDRKTFYNDIDVTNASSGGISIKTLKHKINRA